MRYLYISLIIILVIIGLSCSNSQPNKSDSTSISIDFKQLGLDISNVSQMTLLKNVSTQIQNKGVDSAITFCNLNASTLIDNLSKKHNVTISRVSLKNRNPKNDLNELEQNLWNHYTTLWPRQNDTIITTQNKTTYYRPIAIGMPTCLKCHGQIKEIGTNTLATIQTLYPNDKATGYQLNQLRGFWKIEFN